MGEHSTEELRRRWEAAKRRVLAAEINERDARADYEERLAKEMLAEHAARGIVPGCKVFAVRGRLGGGWIRTPAAFIGVERDWAPGRVLPVLGALKADGSPSKAKRSIAFDRLEPYVEPEAGA